MAKAWIFNGCEGAGLEEAECAASMNSWKMSHRRKWASRGGGERGRGGQYAAYNHAELMKSHIPSRSFFYTHTDRHAHTYKHTHRHAYTPILECAVLCSCVYMNANFGQTVGQIWFISWIHFKDYLLSELQHLHPYKYCCALVVILTKLSWFCRFPSRFMWLPMVKSAAILKMNIGLAASVLF